MRTAIFSRMSSSITWMRSSPARVMHDEPARNQGSDSGRNSMLKATTHRSADSDRKPKNSVLVVDDEKDLVDLISYNLQRNGFKVLTATTGDAAIEIAMREAPNLILLDLMLPGMSGTEVARKLKSEPQTAGIPIIMLTAKSEETDVVVGLTLGADDYVTKPFSMKILLARLNTVLRRNEPAPASTEAGTLRAGPLAIDFSKDEVAIDGQP